MGAKGQKQATQKQRAEAVLVYRQTLDVSTTALRTGLSRAQVRIAIRLAGLTPSRSFGGACYRHLDTLRAMLAGGATFSDVARQIGTTHHKVSAFVAKHSIPHTPWTREGEGNPHWKGGKMTDPDGYVLVKRRDHPCATRHGYVREHRIVMEERLGRPLLPSEVVHHIDGDRQNNAPENLGLFASNREHLASTLAGRRPRWTPDGWAAMTAPRPHTRGRARTATRPPSGERAAPSPRRKPRSSS
jgi:hypothetical protein